MRLYASLRKRLDCLIGEPTAFSLENRIYDGFCLLGLLGIVISILVNFYLNLAVSAVLLLIIFAVLGCLYYLARFKKKFNVSIIATGVLILVIFPLNYIYNAGIAGPALITFLVCLFFLLAISPKNQYQIWYSLNVISVLSLLWVEFAYPRSIQVTYPNKVSLFLDNAFTYLTVSFLLYFGVRFIKSNYASEKKRGEEKTVILDRLNTEKTKLFSIISHDLRGPLATVQQYLEHLKDLDLTVSERLKFEQELLDITKSTQEMLTNLLSWSKSQMDGSNINITPNNLLELLKSTLELHQIIANKKAVVLNCNINPSYYILADPEMFQLVIRNLLNNAIKFTPKGGQIDIEAAKKGHNCLISVRDTGQGIPIAQQESVFSVASKSTFGTANEPGTGLGLALCKDFIEAQNGEIWFASAEGKGTSFTVSIPYS